jgi:hypothetical protein
MFPLADLHTADYIAREWIFIAASGQIAVVAAIETFLDATAPYSLSSCRKVGSARFICSSPHLLVKWIVTTHACFNDHTIFSKGRHIPEHFIWRHPDFLRDLGYRLGGFTDCLADFLLNPLLFLQERLGARHAFGMLLAQTL